MACRDDILSSVTALPSYLYLPLRQQPPMHRHQPGALSCLFFEVYHGFIFRAG